MLGLDQGTVRLADYHPAWSRLYEAEAAVLRDTVGDLLVGLEHVGSTAVPGLAAKPIIDLMAGLDSLADVPACRLRLEGAGYEYLGEYGIPGRHFFVRSTVPVAAPAEGQPALPPRRTHHLHLVLYGAAFWVDHLLFRDYLRRHPETAAAYARLKHDLARLHAADRETYTESKTAFICEVLARARAEAD